jgi:hypothetical protein
MASRLLPSIRGDRGRRKVGTSDLKALVQDDEEEEDEEEETMEHEAQAPNVRGRQARRHCK